MSIFAIADLHLSMAPGTEKPMDVFGNRWFNHVERIRENWCRMVDENDTVIVAGDISWGLKLEEARYDLDWVDKLPGKKVLLKGNHDLWWAGITRLNSMYNSIRFLQNDAIVAEGVWLCGSRGWITPDDDDFKDADEKIYNRELIRLKASLDSVPSGEKILGFLHYPPVSNPGHYSGFMQLFEDYNVGNVYYGHIHGEDAFKKAIQGEYNGTEYRIISADYLNCCPLRIKEGR
ncbi:MAG: metallophosphoesterase [Eubacteriales bacterium]|nr:metallophosphoesterase [Eubacteriales bacterium]